MSALRTVDAIERLTGGATGCLGAAFLTYTFDATFFEEELLAFVLPLREDPAESTRRFLEEGRRKLIEVPVLVIADPGMLRGGQRLPFELLRANPARVFHPKLALLLYPEGARLVVGSGNLTPGGYGGNAELSAALSLAYDRDADLIAHVVAFIEACGAQGEAWERLMAELRPRLQRPPAVPGGPPWFIHSHGSATLLDAFLERLPTAARVKRIGVLAPFHQEDDAPPEGALLDRLLNATKGRRVRGFTLDVGVSWESNPVAPSGALNPDFAEHKGRLWGRVDGKPGQETTRWFILGEHVGHCYAVDDGRQPGLWSTRELNSLRAAGALWPLGPLEAFAPARLVARAARRASVKLWLHPALHRRQGRIYQQPLHGKLIAVTVQEGKKEQTWVLVGSPNASAAALLRADGNIECALVLVLDGAYHLGQLCEQLVLAPLEQVALRARAFAPQAPSPARWVRDAVYDAQTAQLTVTWQPGAPRLTLVYPGAKLTLFEGAPTAPTRIEAFALSPGCCELEVQEPATGSAGRVPLRVVGIVHLAAEDTPGEPDLDELLLLHSGRGEPAGLTARRAARSAAGEALLDQGEGLGQGMTPREIFRALLAAAAALQEAASLGAFQALLQGPWGVGKLAARLIAAPSHGELSAAEAWIYAQELARALDACCFDDPTGPTRAARCSELAAWLRAQAALLGVDLPGMEALERFYGGER